MAYDKKGYNPNSLANLSKGSNMAKLMFADGRSRELANIILGEEVEYNGEKMTSREAILRQQVTQAIAGDLRACQFLIELAGRNEQGATAIKTAVSPLEQLQAIMQQNKIDDRRRKT